MFKNITEEGLRMLKTVVDPAYKTKPVARQQRNNGLTEEQRRILQTNRNKHLAKISKPLSLKFRKQILKLTNPKIKKKKSQVSR